MTNGVYDERWATGTEDSAFEFVQVDLNGVYNIKGVVIGCDWLGPKADAWNPSEPSLGGSWGKSYTENCDVESSLDGKNWNFLFNTGVFEKPIQIYPVNTRARYLRITSEGYMAVTEFYAI